MGVRSKPVDPEHISIDGNRLAQLFDIADRQPPTEIDVAEGYRVDLFSLRQLLRRAEEQHSRNASATRRTVD